MSELVIFFVFTDRPDGYLLVLEAVVLSSRNDVPQRQSIAYGTTNTYAKRKEAILVVRRLVC